VEEERLVQWMSGLVGSTTFTAGEVEVGSRSREVIEMGWARTEVGTEITDYKPTSFCKPVAHRRTSRDAG
jgi:hypothetical protein